MTATMPTIRLSRKQAAQLLWERAALIEDVTAASRRAVDEDAGGWATDRIIAIASIEWDLVEAGIEGWSPFNLARHRITGEGACSPLRDGERGPRPAWLD